MTSTTASFAMFQTLRRGRHFGSVRASNVRIAAEATGQLRNSLKEGVQLVAVLAVWLERMGSVCRSRGEERLEGLFDKAGAVFSGRPDLVHPEDTSIVEAGAVVERPCRLSEVEEASAERVVIHGVAVVLELELGDMRVGHETPSPSQTAWTPSGSRS
jgi:hypothetical protein